MTVLWKWIKGRELIVRHIMRSDAPAAERHLGTALGRAVKVPNKYVPLHDYLANRYADNVVLTFGQLEDLLGRGLVQVIVFRRLDPGRQDGPPEPPGPDGRL